MKELLKTIVYLITIGWRLINKAAQYGYKYRKELFPVYFFCIWAFVCYVNLDTPVAPVVAGLLVMVGYWRYRRLPVKSLGTLGVVAFLAATAIFLFVNPLAGLTVLMGAVGLLTYEWYQWEKSEEVIGRIRRRFQSDSATKVKFVWRGTSEKNND